MDKNKLIIALSIFLLILGLSAAIPVLKKRVPQKSISPNILLITQPVTSFSGIVEKIKGNIVTISQKVIEQSQIAPPLAQTNTTSPIPFPTPVIKTIAYNVLISEKTVISQAPSYINYLFISPTPAPQTKLSVQDIKKGRTISVNTNVDLRTLSANEFEATAVNLPQITNTLNGKIVSLTDNTLTLKAFAPVTAAIGAGNAAPSAPQEKEYRVTLTSDTEISRMLYGAPAAPGEIPQLPKAEKLAPSDLKKDMQATVYTAQDVSENKELTALRIEPIIPIVMPTLAVPSPIASPSPILSP